tara:strand:+ start:21 stop:1478 length:1458 start_codon:yes stop_codon:yes gene_type:complete
MNNYNTQSRPKIHSQQKRVKQTKLKSNNSRRYSTLKPSSSKPSNSKPISKKRMYIDNNGEISLANIRKHSRKHKSNNVSIEIELLKEKHVSKTDFGGYPLDLFFGILFLKMKHKKRFGLPFNMRELITLYSDDIKHNRSFTFIGCMVYKCKDSIINKGLYSSSEEEESSEEESNNSSSSISSNSNSYEIKINLAKNNSNSRTGNSRTSNSRTSNSRTGNSRTSNSRTGNSRTGNSRTSNSIGKMKGGGRPKYTFRKNDFEIELPGRVDITKMVALFNELRKTKRFTAIPLIIRWSCTSNFSGHANILLIDLVKKTIERFEPYGKIHTFDNAEDVVLKTFDSAFSKLIHKSGYTYYKTKRFSPRKGPQFIEEEKVFDVSSNISSEKPGDPEGFCGAWSLWYADLRLSNPKVPRKKLLAKAIKMLKYKNKDSLRAFIRNYATFVVNNRNKFIKKLNIKKHAGTRLTSYVRDLSDKKTAIEQLLKTEK